MKLKKFLVTFLSFAMIMTMLPITSYAILTDAAGGKKADVKLVLMKEKTGTSSGELKYEPVSAKEISKTKDSEFYVGIYGENFDRIKEVAEHTGTAGGSTKYGLNDICFGLSFNKDYLQFEPDAYMDLDEDGIKEFYIPSNVGPLVSERLDYNNSILKKSVAFKYTVGDDTLLSLGDNMEQRDIDRGLNQSVAISLKFTNTSMSYPYSGDKPGYMAIVKFKFTQNAENLEPGTTILGFSYSNYADTNVSLNTLGFGRSSRGDNVVYQDDYSENAGDLGTQNIRNIIKFDEQPIYPDAYTVKYNANADKYSDAGYKDGITEDQQKEIIEQGSVATLKNSEGKIISSLLNPINGYIFQGWSTDKDTYDGNEFNLGTAVTKDNVDENKTLEVFAHYTEGYEVKFNLNANDAHFFGDATATDPISIPKGNGVPTINTGETLASFLGGGDPERTGYTFDGWYTKNANGAFVEKYDENKLKANTAPLDLYAKWQATLESDATKEFTIEFDKNTTSAGAQDSDPVSVKFNSGDSLDSIIGGLPKEPTRTDGYNFAGWYLNKSGDGTKLKSSDPLETYTGATAANPTVKVYARWDYADLPDPTESDPNPTPNPKATTVKVKFDKTGGTYNGGDYKYTTIEDKYVNYGQTIEYLPSAENDEMTQTDKVFKGWYTSTNLEDPNTKEVTTSTLIDNTLDSSLNAATGGEITLYAVWTDKVTVEYNLNGFPGTAPASHEDFPGESFTVASALSDANYNFVGWSTSANNSTGTADYTADSVATMPAQDTTLYAIYEYIGPNPVTLVFKGNGTATNAATVIPSDLAATDQYTIVRAPGSTVTAEQMPTATRDNYTFDHWSENATDALLADGEEQADIVLPNATAPTTVNAYAIWKVTNPANRHTVTFDPVESDTTPAGTTTIEVADGDTVNTFPTYTKTGKNLKGWWKVVPAAGTEYNESDGNAFTSSTPVTDDITVYGVWADEVTVTYHSNNADSTTGSLDPVTMTSGQKLTDVGATLPTATRANYISSGWKYKDDTGMHDFDENTVVTKDIDVYAAWEAKIRVDFRDVDGTTIKYPYDGTGKTPVKDDNFDVYLLDSDQNIINPALEGFTTADFIVKYKTDDVAGDPTDTTVPVNADTYEFTLEINTSNPASTLDPYTQYTVTAYPSEFTIEGMEINYTISDNYQYMTNVSAITNIGIAVDGTPAQTPNINISDVLNGDAIPTTGRTADIDIVFTNVKNSSKVFTNRMPDEFGEYNISVTAVDGSNFKVGTVKDADNVTPAKLYIMSLSRQVDMNYGDGFVKAGGVTTADHVKTNYVTVTIPEPNPKKDVQNAKTTFAQQSPAVALPVEGTDFVAPQGMRLKRFYTLVFNEDGTPKMTDGVNQDRADFTATTDIPSDASPLTVYAEYENAEWTVTFRDTKTDPAAEVDKRYTIASEKAIGETEDDGTPAVQKVETVVGNVATEITGLTDDQLKALPVPTEAPANMMFGGWTTDSSVAALTNLKKEDIEAGGTHADKMFTTTNKPGDTLVGTSTDITVYAVYVLSDNAALSGVEFKETDETGDAIPFVADLYATPAPGSGSIEFSDSVLEYNLIVDNDVENVFEKFTPAQKGSTVEVTKKLSTDTAATTVTTDKDTDTGAVKATTGVEATTYKDGANSINIFEVKVTAPDGSDKTYTFNILRYAEAKITLSFGNSPFGLMEAMRFDGENPWDDTKISDAKTNFITKSSTLEANRFKPGFVPSAGKDNIIYTIDAWEKSEDPVKNMDRNVYSIFAYNGRDFEDTGFEAYDSLAKPVDATAITRSITIGTMSDKTIQNMQTTSLTPKSVSVTNEAAKYTFTDFTSSNVCPGKYEMVYSFTDPVTGKTIKNAKDDSELTTSEAKAAENLKRRYIVYVWNRGDANMSTAIETGDQSTISELIVNKIKFDGIASDVVALYRFRMADANMSTAMETGDQSTISELIVRKITNPEFYR